MTSTTPSFSPPPRRVGRVATPLLAAGLITLPAAAAAASGGISVTVLAAVFLVALAVALLASAVGLGLIHRVDGPAVSQRTAPAAAPVRSTIAPPDVSAPRSRRVAPPAPVTQSPAAQSPAAQHAATRTAGTPIGRVPVARIPADQAIDGRAPRTARTESVPPVPPAPSVHPTSQDPVMYEPAEKMGALR